MQMNKPSFPKHDPKGTERDFLGILAMRTRG